MDDLVFTTASEEDIDEIVKFNGYEDREHFRWEYLTRKPELSLFTVAKDAGKIIGSEAVWPYTLNMNGREIQTARSERTLINPNYRGREVWTRLMDYCAGEAERLGHQFIWGTTTAERPFKSAGFLFLTGFRLYTLCALNPLRVIRYLASGKSRVSLNPIPIIRAYNRVNRELGIEYAKAVMSLPSIAVNAALKLASPARMPADIEIVDQPRSYQDVTDLYNRMRADTKFIHLAHERDFIEWIFARGKHPYKAYFAYRENQLAAYIYVDLADPVTAVMLDFAADGTDVMRGLVNHVKKDLNRSGKCFFIATFNPLNPQQQALLPPFYREGFIPFHKGGRWVVRPLAYKNLNVLGDLSSWYITDLWFIIQDTLRAPKVVSFKLGRKYTADKPESS